ncbi:hypothetical protein A3K73_01650 [Candidatus Pacearchaeota archaeon RBG_13_36_9]|nr:MAG: hypothetical protein A3K73_01650 [Candidatus Pacearchaeota archaeon RBG_13_36_9]
MEIKSFFREFALSILIFFPAGYRTAVLDKKRNISGKFIKVPFVNTNSDHTLEPWVLESYTKKYVPKEGDTVVDAGAFYGIFTIYASKLVGKNGRVIAFEPEPFSYKVLKKNLKLNNIENVLVVRKGLWRKNGILNFSGRGGVSSLILNYGKDFNKKIRVTTLDNALKPLRNPKINFIKMDIEGAEIEAIKGMEETIKKDKPNFAIASYHKLNNQQTKGDVEKLLRDRGYSVFSGSKHLTTYAY